MKWAQQQNRPWLAGVVELMRRAVEATPEQAQAWQKLGTTQLMAGDAAAGAVTLREACGRFPADAGMRLQLARAEMALGRLEQALAAAEEAAQMAPEMGAAAGVLFQLLVRMARTERAEQMLPRYAALGGASVPMFHFAVARAREQDAWEPLLELCDTIRARSPGNTGARYYRALALIRLGRREEARLDPAQFLWTGKLPLAEGETEAGFLAEVRREILANPTLMPDPRGYTTTHGMQTRELPRAGDKAVMELCARLRAAVDRYEAEMAAWGTADAFIADRPKRAALTPWAVVYPGEGKQRSHIHAPGWVSGVYYVAAPPGGELMLGAMDSEDVGEAPWQVVRVQPEANLLALFPSFIPHATEATHAEELRICVAFDVVPE